MSVLAVIAFFVVLEVPEPPKATNIVKPTKTSNDRCSDGVPGLLHDSFGLPVRHHMSK